MNYFPEQLLFDGLKLLSAERRVAEHEGTLFARQDFIPISAKRVGLDDVRRDEQGQRRESIAKRVLSNQITQLLEGFVKSFDSSRPPDVEFRDAHRRAAEKLCQSGMGMSSALVGIFVKIIVEYMEERADYIWGRLQHIIRSIDVQSYAELNSDLKTELARHFNTVRQIAERDLQRLFVSTKAPAPYATEIARLFDNILLKLNPEVDLFCAQRRAAEEREKQVAGTNINNFTGVLGNVTNSQITVNDFSSIFQILRERHIPREARNQLEDIWDALQTSPADEKQSLVQQGKEWIAKHKDALGTGAEIISKAIET